MFSFQTQGNKGHMAVTAFAMSTVLLAGVGTANYFSTKEQAKIVKANESSEAMKMAEQGLSRAAWKLQERVENWTQIMKDEPLDGYNFDQKYTEEGGEYTIKIERATAANIGTSDTESKVLITVVGRDSNHTGTKALKVVYLNESEKPTYAVYVMNDQKHKRKTKDNLLLAAKPEPAAERWSAYAKALAVGAMDAFTSQAYAAPDDDFEYSCDEDQFRGVHWGPLVCLGDWKMANKYNRYWLSYPRKFATGGISGRDMVKDAPNTDGVEWWSYNDQVPSAPSIDYNYYRTLAMNNGVDPATGSRPTFMGHTLVGAVYHTRGNGSNCIPAHKNQPGSNENSREGEDVDSHWIKNVTDNPTQPRLYYFDQINGKFTGNTFVHGLVISNGGKLVIKQGVRATSSGQYTTAVPPRAWREYARIDTAASGEYPADNGYQNNSGTYTFDNTNAVTIHGLLMATKKVELSGKAVVHGVVVAGKNFHFDGVGECAIYYDHTINLQAAEVSLVQEQYNEVAMSWPDGI